MKSIKTRLMVWLMAGITIIVGVTGWISYAHNKSQDEADYRALRTALQERMSLSLPHGVWQLDDQYIRLALDAELGWTSIMAISIQGDAGLNIGRTRDTNGSLRDMTPTEKPFADDIVTIPIIYLNKEKLGTASIYLSRAALDQRLRNHLIEIIAQIAILDTLIFFVMTFNLRRFVFDPLQALQQALNRAASSENAKSAQIDKVSDDEFGSVVLSFNRIVDRIAADLERRSEMEQLALRERDKTEEAYRKLLETQQTLVETEKLASLGGLVAGVAHEINTPVGISLTTASHLVTATSHISEKLNQGGIKKSDFQAYLETAKESCNLILSNAEKAANLIHSFKQIAVDQTSEARRDFQLLGYLNEIITSLKPKFKRSKTTIEVHCEEDLLLDSYPGAFSQVITNLLVNALMHGFEEKEGGHITITARIRSDNSIAISIEDNGKGIAAENLGKIFEPFFTTRRGAGGSGLGLHIVYNIVRQKLGGTIDVKSIEGQGTTFTITMPTIAPDYTDTGRS